MVKPTNVIFMGGLQTLSGWPTSIGARAIQRLALVGRADPRCPWNRSELNSADSYCLVVPYRCHVGSPSASRYPAVRTMLTFSSFPDQSPASRCALRKHKAVAACYAPAPSRRSAGRIKSGQSQNAERAFSGTYGLSLLYVPQKHTG